ncbi:hypothetical protein EON64_11030 [archaeon]|nr:MAG: hypothetical protein EON64_11030 [archaeon]
MIFLLLLCIVANSKSLCPNQSQLRCSLSKGLQVTQLCASTPPRPTVSGAPEGLRSLVRSYNSALSKHAHPTKMITSAVVAGLGDLLIQLLNHKLHGARKVAVDLRRLFVFMAVAGFYMAPATHWWFNFLDRMPVLRGKSRWAQSLIMIAVDQTAGALLITSGFFFAFELVSTSVSNTLCVVRVLRMWMVGVD